MSGENEDVEVSDSEGMTTETPEAEAPAEQEPELVGAWADFAEPSTDGPSEEGEPPVESEEEQPDAEPAPAPDLPDGFGSLDELKREAVEARQLRERLQQYETYVQRLHAAQAPQGQPQQPAQQPQGRGNWAPPHADDLAAQQAMDLLRAGNADHFKALPPDVQERGKRLYRYVAERWADYERDPGKLVEEHVLPVVEARVQQRVAGLERIVNQFVGERFLQQHASVVKDQQDLGRLRQLAAYMPPEEAVRIVATERKLRELEAKASKVDERARVQQKQREQARSQQSTKGRGSRDGRPSQPRLGTTDPLEIARRVKKELAGGD